MQFCRVFPIVLEKKLGEPRCNFLWRKMVKSGIFHVQNHVFHEFALCCWRNKVPEIYKPKWFGLPGVPLQFRKPWEKDISPFHQKWPNQMFCGHRAEDRNICLGAEISKESSTFRIILIERRYNRRSRNRWGYMPCEEKKPHRMFRIVSIKPV